jgi:hypothetical protein
LDDVNLLSLFSTRSDAGRNPDVMDDYYGLDESGNLVSLTTSSPIQSPPSSTAAAAVSASLPDLSNTTIHRGFFSCTSTTPSPAASSLFCTPLSTPRQPRSRSSQNGCPVDSSSEDLRMRVMRQAVTQRVAPPAVVGKSDTEDFLQRCGG